MLGLMTKHEVVVSRWHALNVSAIPVPADRSRDGIAVTLENGSPRKCRHMIGLSDDR